VCSQDQDEVVRVRAPRARWGGDVGRFDALVLDVLEVVAALQRLAGLTLLESPLALDQVLHVGLGGEPAGRLGLVESLHEILVGAHEGFALMA